MFVFSTALLFAAGASARGDGVEALNNVPKQVESKTRLLTQAFGNHSVEVSRCYFKLYTANDCDYTLDKMRTCYGNNPAAPYITFTVPSWPEKFVDPIHPEMSNIWGPSAPGNHDICRFDARGDRHSGAKGVPL